MTQAKRHTKEARPRDGRGLRAALGAPGPESAGSAPLDARGPESAGSATMAAAALTFAAAGAVVGLAGVLLPHAPGMDETGVALCASGAALMAVLAFLGADRLPRWIFHAGCLVATAIATTAIWFWGEQSLYGPLAYLWPAVYAFFLFPLRWALVQIAAIGGLFAGLLVLREPLYEPVAEWFATMGTLLSAGLVVGLARRRVSTRLSTLVDAARRDPLTGLLNRPGFEEAFDLEIERARRSQQSLSVILGDLDRFKQINDSYGHAAGDDALRQVGAAIGHSKRSWDSAARIGGEEFAIIAPDTDEHGAYILAERIRTAVERHFEGAGPVPLSISFGLVTWPVHGETAATLLEAGDQALYAAKTLGRNRTVISSAEVPGILARSPRAREGGHVEVSALLTLAEALDVRDSGTASHCQRVGRYAELIARELGLAPDSVERVRIAGILHDVGRVGVSDDLFKKHGALSDREWAQVRAHPEIGARMLETTDFADIGRWIASHHERPDGTGYPAGASGENVPLEAAILAVADAYEAMTAVRSYRAPLDPQAASDELRRGAGHQWDGRVVEALLRVV